MNEINIADVLTEETDVSLDKIEEYTHVYYETIDEEILSTDWEKYDIVDVVEKEDTVEIHRYSDEAPPLNIYVDGEPSVTVTRVTEVQLRWMDLLQY